MLRQLLEDRGRSVGARTGIRRSARSRRGGAVRRCGLDLVPRLGHPDRPVRSLLAGARDLSAALDRVAIPVRFVSGWQDLFLGQTLAEYRRLRDRGIETALTIGPWTHADFLTGAGAGLRRDAGVGRPSTSGAGATPSTPTRSPTSSPARGVAFRVRSGHPRSSTARSTSRPEEGSPTASRPPRPARSASRTTRATPPTLGGRLPRARRRVPGGLRSRAPLRHAGLRHHSADRTARCRRGSAGGRGAPQRRPGADLWVRISEVEPGGRSHNVTEAFRAAPTPEMDGRTVVELDRSPTGSRRVRASACSSAGSPRYARNLGMPGSRTEGTAMAPTHQALDLASGASALSLPVPT